MYTIKLGENCITVFRDKVTHITYVQTNSGVAGATDVIGIMQINYTDGKCTIINDLSKGNYTSIIDGMGLKTRLSEAGY